jgi:trehalose 6-phosphate synthase/phosphatase
MRLIIVANRLPFSITKEGEQFNFKRSPGGLVSGFLSYLSSLPQGTDYLWLGWPGNTIEDQETQKLIKHKSLKEYNSLPVFLDQTQIDNFYRGFCNQTLWPILHNFSSFMELSDNFWKSYVEVNKLFAKQLLKVLRPDDLILIQDFHLMLLPKLIREKMPQAKISFFLHTPFPTHQFYKLLPKSWREGMLEGVLGADLIGFHTSEYTRNFKSNLSHIFGLESFDGQVMQGDRMVRFGTFPLGIDFKSFQSLSNSPEILKMREEYRQSLGQRKIIISVDRLDYTKGITNKIRGFSLFLKNHPDWHKKLSLLLIASPSREEIERFQMTKKEVDELVGEVNGELGTLDWMPIIYLHKSHSQEELIALYGLSDAALITPLRDGMNLVSKEYVASKTEKNGALILSRMAGAAHELKEGIMINPIDYESIAQGIETALTMSERERIDRFQILSARLREQTVFDWARQFNGALVRQTEPSIGYFLTDQDTELKSKTQI